MKNILLSIIAIAFLVACESDSYDKGTGTYSLMTGDLVEVSTNSDSYVTSFTTDDDTKYTLTSYFKTEWATAADTTYRALLYYNLEGDGYAEAVSISEVPVLTLYVADSLETIYTDPVNLESVWISKNGKYVNLGLYVKTGTSDDIVDYQSVAMLYSGTSYNDDGTNTINLTFYHDQGDVPEYYSSKYYFSVRTSNLKVAVSDSTSLSTSNFDYVDPATARQSENEFSLHSLKRGVQLSTSYVLADSVSITVNTYDDGVVTKTLAID